MVGNEACILCLLHNFNGIFDNEGMSAKNKTILLVDDDEDILRILNKILTNAGFKVFQALSPEEARSILEQDPPHLIVSDLNMEPEDGYTFISKLKSHSNLQHIPIIVLSAVNDFNSVKRVIGLGINDYVIKPLQAHLILRKIRKALLNKDFVTWTPRSEEGESLVVQIPAKIMEIGEVGLKISGPFKIPNDHEIRIHSPEVDELGMNKLVLKSSDLSSSHSSGGHFICDIGMIGSSEETASKIRQFVQKRKMI